ncbi:hypothetical protein NSA31_22480 [Bacillus subtilis]|nr:hypothetical protein [Bacillus subtilis]MCR1994509.1 hypothetical protein [Bacillus subtilis]
MRTFSYVLGVASAALLVYSLMESDWFYVSLNAFNVLICAFNNRMAE